MKWIECEGTFQLQMAQRTWNEKTLEAARAWVALVELLKESINDDTAVLDGGDQPLRFDRSLKLVAQIAD